MKQAIVIRHLAFEDLGSFADVLRERAINIVYVDAAQDDLAAIDPLTEDLLIILGGPISANDSADYPFIEQELALLRQRLVQDLPTLGICLGAQLMAHALGARVYAGEQKEIGWSGLELSVAGRNSALKYLHKDRTSVLHWHGETFDLPAGAVHLAASALYPNQAFAFGRRTLGLQFHAECTEQGLQSWYIGHVGEIQQTAGVSVPMLRQQAQHFASESARCGQLFFAAWLDQVMT